MTTFDDLDPVLAREYHPDYWSDDVVVYAGTLVDALDAAGWSRLDDAWPSRPSLWQVQLADALTGSSQPQRDAVLAAMLRSADLEVARAAANSLIASRSWSPDDGDRRALAALRERMAPGERGIVEELISRARA